MRRDVSDPNIIRRYLLGELTQEADREAIEERMLLDDAFFEEFEIAKESLIDEYINDELTGQERGEFDQHFLTTPERREDLREAQALARYARKSVSSVASQTATVVTHESRSRSVVKWLPTASWKIAASLILVMGLSFTVWRTFFYRTDAEQGLLALKAAYRFQRPVEARISALDYAPLPDTRGRDESKIDPIARQRAEVKVLEAEKDEPGAASYHALGLFYVTQLKFDEAIKQFNRALQTDENDARLHSDLATALLEKGKIDRSNGAEEKSFEEFSESLQHLNRALQLNNSLPEALFNRALCHSYLSLPQAATEDWRKYLEIDSTSLWADEARQNLKLLESQKNKTSQNKDQIREAFLNAYQSRNDETAWSLLSSNRDVSGGFLQNELLDKYLIQEADGRTDDAQRSLQALSYAGELDSKRANDRFLTNLVHFYASATRSQRMSLMEARKLVSQGHKSLQVLQSEEAAEYYSRAAQTFDRLGDHEESVYIRYPLAHAYLLMHESERSLAIFKTVVHDSEANQYQWLLAQSLSGLGNAQIGLSEYSEALNNSNRSREISEQIDDVRGQMKIADQLCNIYTRLGNYSEAIRTQQRALTLISEHSVDWLQAWRTHFLIATPLHLLGLDAAAEDFQKESLRIAKEAGNLYSICRSHIGLGLIYGTQGNYEEATINVRLAFDLAKSIKSEATRTDTVGYSSLQLGHLYRRAGDFNKAMASYDDVLKTYAGSDYPAFLYAAHKGKLLSCIAQGGCPSVELEIETTVDLFENYRAKIQEQENQFIFFGAEQSVYDAVIDYRYSTNPNSDEAFDFSERSRARSLLDLTTSQESPSVKNHSNLRARAASVSQAPMSAAEIRQRMPEPAQLVQYSVLQHRVLIWLISKSGIQQFAQNIEAQDLRDKVSRYQQLLSNPSSENAEELRSVAAEFYDLLIRPLAAALDRDKELCVVPDKALNDLPYAAFFSRSSGKYLTEEYILTRAPSATIFVLSSEKAQTKEITVPEKLLSVGDPRFDRTSFPTLNDLPAAKREAEEVARFYNASAITGDKALKNRVVSEMQYADVIHLALHAVVNEDSPLRSKLLFAKENSSQSASEEPGVLRVDDLQNLHLPRIRLVVLSACQTGSGRYYDGEGVVGISRPFIAQGVPLVVASLWAVDSEATASLMIDFHRNRVKGHMSTARALSLAQRQMLSSSDRRYQHPYYWASFVTIGGYARF